MDKYFEKYIKLNEDIKTTTDIGQLKILKEQSDTMFNLYLGNQIQDNLLTDISNSLNESSLGELFIMFENITPELIKTTKGKQIINKFIKTIKEDKNLLSIYILHENINYPKPIDNIKIFISEAFELINNIDQTTITEFKNKVFTLLNTGIKVTQTDINQLLPNVNIKKLNESIDYLIGNEKSMKNLLEWSNKMSYINNHLEVNRPTTLNENTKSGDVDTMIKVIIDHINETYGEKFSPEDLVIFKEYLELNANPEDAWNQYKNHCIERLSELKIDADETLKTRLTEITRKVEDKIYKPETVFEDIIQLRELNKTLE